MGDDEQNDGCGLPDPGMIASATGMRARDPWEMERFALKTYPCVVCGKGEVWKPDHECNKCRSRKPAFAVIDGVGDTAEVHLYATIEDVQHDRECKWPFGWPNRVSQEFLEAHGCKVRTT